MDRDAQTPSRLALITILGTLNYFYDLSGRRLAKALHELGFAVAG